MSLQTLVAPDLLEARVENALRNAGAAQGSAAAAVRAMMHASLIGVDSHGVRLVVHYDRVLRGGRVNGTPNLSVRRTAAATAVVTGIMRSAIMRHMSQWTRRSNWHAKAA